MVQAYKKYSAIQQQARVFLERVLALKLKFFCIYKFVTILSFMSFIWSNFYAMQAVLDQRFTSKNVQAKSPEGRQFPMSLH